MSVWLEGSEAWVEILFVLPSQRRTQVTILVISNVFFFFSSNGVERPAQCLQTRALLVMAATVWPEPSGHFIRKCPGPMSPVQIHA